MRNYTTAKDNSDAVVIQPDKWHKWRIVLIGSVCAIKKNDISESLVVKSGLTIRPEQSLQMASFINQVPEEKKNLNLALASPPCD